MIFMILLFFWILYFMFFFFIFLLFHIIFYLADGYCDKYFCRLHLLSLFADLRVGVLLLMDMQDCNSFFDL